MRTRSIVLLLSTALVLGWQHDIEGASDELGRWSTVADPIVCGAPNRPSESVLLSDGRVMVTGRGSRKAEIYDPATDGWALAEERNQDVLDAKMIALSDGRVLVPSMVDYNQFALELYDPSIDSWRKVDTLGRSFYRGVLVDTNKVLFVEERFGGVQGDIYLYDPLEDSWQRRAPPLVKTGETSYREIHVFIAFGNGHVLLTGISDETGAPDSEVYSYVSDIWEPTPAKKHNYPGMSALALSDNEVIATGGIEEWIEDPLFSNSVELFNYANREWVERTGMSFGMSGHDLLALDDGRVFAIGTPLILYGVPAEAVYQIYHPDQETWIGQLPEMCGSRLLPTATKMPDGKVLVAGASHDGTAEIFIPDEVGDNVCDPRTTGCGSDGGTHVDGDTDATDLVDRGDFVEGGLDGSTYSQYVEPDESSSGCGCSTIEVK